MRVSFAFVLFAACGFAAMPKASVAHASGSLIVEDGWIDLMKPDVWKKVDPGWIVATGVKLDADKGTKLVAEKSEKGTIWVNGEKGRLPNLVTKEEFGDCQIHVEFLVAKNSNAGVKFHEVYEIQILDSYGKKDIDGSGNGGIYPPANLEKRRHLDKGVPP